MALSYQIAQDVLDLTLADGGGTFHNDGTPIDTRERVGYALSINEELGRVIPIRDITQTDVSIYFHDMARENKYIGTWVFDGNVYLDVVTIVPELELALEIAAAHDQLAIYDLYNGNEIPLEPDAADIEDTYEYKMGLI